MTTQAERMARLSQTAGRYGITPEDLVKLLACEHTLHRWAELECGDGNDVASWAIERDPETDVPYHCIYPHQGKMYRTRIPDREAGARRRVAAILKRYPLLVAVYQGDPRGCALSLVKVQDTEGIDPCNWAARGFAVCV